jgi:hypothetical protein
MNREMHRTLEQLMGTKVVIAHAEDDANRAKGRDIKGWFDLVTLLAVLSGATLLGLIALGIVTDLYMDRQMRIVYGLIGLSALWQWSRQRF